MARPRTRANQNSQEPDLANVILQDNVVPPQENSIPPVVPQVPEVHQEVPQNAEVPIAPIGDFVTEFRTMYYNKEILVAQQEKFNSFKQGSMTVLEVVKKFVQLACLCSELVPNETEKVRRRMKMFRTDIAKRVSAGSSPPTPIADCIGQAIRAEYWINQDKEAKIQIHKAKKENKHAAKHLWPRRNPKLYSKGQTRLPTRLMDFTQKLGRKFNRLEQLFRISFPSGEILLSDYWIRGVPIVIYGRELYVDLVVIKLQDYDVILGMEFLGKYNTKIECR
ncbi:hypothetical protein TIFTF001_017129 [Ficus carica]|uniref:Uncharacterized protein n=1 Tax=Ficus carica TaxID=3494 RepID=A0AA88D9D7_FICCA|nr:hypothetical protein TIFTF001_017129 [Ficus carica]